MARKKITPKEQNYNDAKLAKENVHKENHLNVWKKKEIEKESDDDSSNNKEVSETLTTNSYGRRKIDIQFIQEKNRRSVTFSKRKKGIMKKAYELSVLTGSEILLLVASETGHVYTFATPKLRPIISSQESFIQQCLNGTDTRKVMKSEPRDQESFEEDFYDENKFAINTKMDNDDSNYYD